MPSRTREPNCPLPAYTRLKYKYARSFHCDIRLRVAARVGHICRHVIRVSERQSVAIHVRKSSAVRGSTGGQRFSAAERRHSALAPQHLLDAAGAELHAMDAWPI